VQATGSYGSYLTQRVAVSGASGVHDLYLVFRARSGVAENHQLPLQHATAHAA
jgi:hypothetical protein